MSADDPDLFPEPTDQPATDQPSSDPASDRLLDAEETAAASGDQPPPRNGGDGDQPPPRNGGDGDGSPPEKNPDGGLRAETGDPDTYPDESVRDAAREPVGANRLDVKIGELQEELRAFDQQTAQVEDSVTVMGLPAAPTETTAYVEQPSTAVGPMEAAGIVAAGAVGLGKKAADRMREARDDRDAQEDVEDDDRPRS